jgi:hypothetical protein
MWVIFWRLRFVDRRRDSRWVRRRAVDANTAASGRLVAIACFARLSIDPTWTWSRSEGSEFGRESRNVSKPPGLAGGSGSRCARAWRSMVEGTDSAMAGHAHMCEAIA